MFKPLRMSDQTTTISIFDPAIDSESMTETDWGAYAEAASRNPSCWRDKIKIKAGETPTVFVIGVIPPDEMARIVDECKLEAGGDQKRMSEASWRCFLIGLRDIQNWSEEIPKRKIGAVEYVDPAWLRSTFVRGLRDVASQVGISVWAFNKITEEEIKN